MLAEHWPAVCAQGSLLLLPSDLALPRAVSVPAWQMLHPPVSRSSPAV